MPTETLAVSARGSFTFARLSSRRATNRECRAKWDFRNALNSYAQRQGLCAPTFLLRHTRGALSAIYQEALRKTRRPLRVWGQPLGKVISLLSRCDLDKQQDYSADSESHVADRSTAFAARPHQTRADDLARLTYGCQLIPALNHDSDPHIGLWVQSYPRPTRS